MDLSNTDMIRMYEQMTRIREFDERAALLMEQARVHGSVHLYCGEEAIAVGVWERLIQMTTSRRLIAVMAIL